MTARAFVGEINKKEANLSPQYQNDLGKLKEISDKILKAEIQKQYPPAITTTPAIKKDKDESANNKHE
jgi:hypothetical protein